MKTWMPGTRPGITRVVSSIDRPDQVLDLVGMWSEILCQLVEQGIGDLLKARLVDVGHDLDAHLAKLARRRMLELEAALGLLQADIPPRGQHPLLLVGGKALPEL